MNGMYINNPRMPCTNSIIHVWLHIVWCYLLLQRSNVCLEVVLHVCKAAILGLVCFESGVPVSQLHLKLTQLLLLGIHLQIITIMIITTTVILIMLK